jgi:hypothetical protein
LRYWRDGIPERRRHSAIGQAGIGLPPSRSFSPFCHHDNQGVLRERSIRIRVTCPSSVIENVARHNGVADINLGLPSTEQECVRVNNNPTP